MKDIALGPTDSWPGEFTDAAGTLFFVADDGSSGAELWRSDGTEGGTRLVTDLDSGPEGSNPTSLVAVGGSVLFVANDGGGYGAWRSDGTAEGTLPLDVALDPGSPDVPVLEGVPVGAEKLLFTVCQGSACSAWVTTASFAGASPVQIDGVDSLIAAAGDLVFVTASVGQIGSELYALPVTELSFCGDLVVDAARGETCDDGNQIPGDGCSATCVPEPGATVLAAAAFGALRLLAKRRLSRRTKE